MLLNKIAEARLYGYGVGYFPMEANGQTMRSRIRSAANPSSFRRRGRTALGVLLAVALAGGCTITIVSGPSTVAVGETVIYVFNLGNNQMGTDSEAAIAAEVPAGWSLVSSSYTVTIDGKPMTFDGTVIESTLCDARLGELAPGFQRLHVAGETFSVNGGTATLEFFVGSQPEGELFLEFAFGGLESFNCSDAAVLSVNHEGGRFVRLLQSLFDSDPGIDGLDTPRQMALAPGDDQLYVASQGDATIATFARDVDSGELTLQAADSGGFGGVPGPAGLAVTADGRHLYGASFSSGDEFGGITTFERDPIDGELLSLDYDADSVGYIVISPDGRHLYAGSSSIHLYERDEETGLLTFSDAKFSGGRQFAMTTDARHLYAVLFSVVRILERDDESGELTLVGELVGDDGLEGATQAVLSPDDRFLYVTGGPAVTVWERDAMTGALSFVESETETTGTALDPIEFATLAISPDGNYVVAGGELALSVFRRHPSTGVLDFIETLFAGNLPIDGIPGTSSLTFSADGRNLYAIHNADDALIVFETAILFLDGFESGTTSAWSSTVP